MEAINSEHSKEEKIKFNGKPCKKGCNCVEVAEVINNGPVKNYPCLEPQESFNVFKSVSPSLSSDKIEEKPDFEKMATGILVVRKDGEPVDEEDYYASGMHECWDKYVKPLKTTIQERDKRIAELEKRFDVNELAGMLRKEADDFLADDPKFSGGMRYAARLLEIHKTKDDRTVHDSKKNS